MSENISIEKAIDEQIEKIMPKSSTMTKEQIDAINEEVEKFLINISKRKELNGFVLSMSNLKPLGCTDIITALIIAKSHSDLELVQEHLKNQPVNR